MLKKIFHALSALRTLTDTTPSFYRESRHIRIEAFAGLTTQFIPPIHHVLREFRRYLFSSFTHRNIPCLVFCFSFRSHQIYLSYERSALSRFFEDSPPMNSVAASYSGAMPPSHAGGPSPHAREWRPSQGHPNNQWPNANSSMFLQPSQQQLQMQQHQQQQWGSHFQAAHFMPQQPSVHASVSHHSPPRHHHAQKDSTTEYNASSFQYFSPSQSPSREESPVSVLGNFVRPTQPPGVKESSSLKTRGSSPDTSSYVSNGTVYFPPPDKSTADKDGTASHSSTATAGGRGRNGSIRQHRSTRGVQPERRAVTHSGQRIMLLSSAVNVDIAAANALVQVSA